MHLIVLIQCTECNGKTTASATMLLLENIINKKITQRFPILDLILNVNNS